MPGLMDILGYIGDSLDKAGPRPLRGLLGGKPRELGSIVPFSDELGITDPKDIVRGRDLTNNIGLTSPEDKGFGAMAAGTGVEMLLDPLAMAGVLKGGLGLHRGLWNMAKGAVEQKGSGVGMTAHHLLEHAFPNKALEYKEAASGMGPMHNPTTGLTHIRQAMEEGRTLGHNLDQLSEDDLTRLAQEIHPGSVSAGRGTEGPYLKSPEGYGTKLSAGSETVFDKAHSGGRADIPESLPPLRSQLFGQAPHQVWAEHTPIVDPLGSWKKSMPALSTLANMHPSNTVMSPEEIAKLTKALGWGHEGLPGLSEKLAIHMKRHLRENYPELHPWDVEARNVARTPTNELTVLDPRGIGHYPIMGEHDMSMRPHGPIPHLPTDPMPTDPDLIKVLMGEGAPQKLQEALKYGATLPIPGWKPPAQLMDKYLEQRDLIEQVMRQYGPMIEQMMGQNPLIGGRGSSLGNTF